jgi:DNA-binding NarL/FixJ family response regulator
MATPIRLMIVDDHPVVRDGLRAILSTQSDLAVVAELENGTGIVEAVSSRRPDVILLDLEMPDVDGIEALRRLRAAGLETCVIVLTVFDTDEHILSAVQAGAQGYLLKGATRDEIFQAIRVVHAGGSLLQPIIASKLLKQVRGTASARPPACTLTPRERDVLRHVAMGLLNKEIADVLHISERTVKFHISAILSKLGAGNRTEAVALATQQGILPIE